jgi:HEPN domain-containing protein
VPIARLNRDKLQRLAEGRLEEATLLMDRRLWTGAYYLTGLAVECALKASLARDSAT